MKDATIETVIDYKQECLKEIALSNVKERIMECEGECEEEHYDGIW